MTTFTAIALDPGPTTGWATYQATKMQADLGEPGYVFGTDIEWYDEKWNCGQISNANDIIDSVSGWKDALETLLGIHHTSEYHIICESFTPRPGKIGAKLDVTPQIIALVQAFVAERDSPLLDQRVTLHMQTPSQAKGFVKDASIKKLGVWFPGQRHAVDAIRHLLFWLINGPYRRQDILEKGWKF